MRLLIDTHAFLWFVAGNARLPTPARALIADPPNTVFVSVASLWEMAIKSGIGKLELDEDFARFIARELSTNRFHILEIDLDHVMRVRDLPMHHKDPFDRMLAAQSLAEGMPVVGRDDMLDLYGVDRRW